MISYCPRNTTHNMPRKPIFKTLDRILVRWTFFQFPSRSWKIWNNKSSSARPFWRTHSTGEVHSAQYRGVSYTKCMGNTWNYEVSDFNSTNFPWWIVPSYLVHLKKVCCSCRNKAWVVDSRTRMKKSSRWSHAWTIWRRSRTVKTKTHKTAY